MPTINTEWPSSLRLWSHAWHGRATRDSEASHIHKSRRRRGKSYKSKERWRKRELSHMVRALSLPHWLPLRVHFSPRPGGAMSRSSQGSSGGSGSNYMLKNVAAAAFSLPRPRPFQRQLRSQLETRLQLRLLSLSLSCQGSLTASTPSSRGSVSDKGKRRRPQGVQREERGGSGRRKGKGSGGGGRNRGKGKGRGRPWGRTKARGREEQTLLDPLASLSLSYWLSTWLLAPVPSAAKAAPLAAAIAVRVPVSFSCFSVPFLVFHTPSCSLLTLIYSPIPPHLLTYRHS